MVNGGKLLNTANILHNRSCVCSRVIARNWIKLSSFVRIGRSGSLSNRVVPEFKSALIRRRPIVLIQGSSVISYKHVF